MSTRTRRATTPSGGRKDGNTRPGAPVDSTLVDVLLAELFGFAAAAFGIAQGVPQARRVRSLGHSRGVSLATWLMMTASSAAWLGYGIRTASPSLVVSTVATGFINASVALAVAGSERSLRSRMVAVAAVFIIGAVVLPTWIVSPVLFFFTFSRLPQIARSWKSRRTGVGETAVSMSSIALGVACLLCWEVYSVLLMSPTLIGTTTIALVTNLAVAWLEISNRRRAAIDSEPVASL